MNQAIENPVTQAILRDIPTAGAANVSVSDISLGSHLAAVRVASPDDSENPRLGLASRVDNGHGRSIARELAPSSLARWWGLSEESGVSALDLARLLETPVPKVEQGQEQTLPPERDPLFRRSVALATVNALLPPPPADADISELKGQELLLEVGRGKRVVVVGHFPFVDKIARDFAAFHVLERRPRPGDLPAEESRRVLPQADVAAITSTSISNNTLQGLLELCREDCFVLLLGPSTPLAPSLFDLGVDALAGAVLHTPENLDSVLSGVRAGHPFKTLEGMRPILWRKQ